MNFPILHIPVVGDGMTIALNAVLHVYISHGLAIGLMTMLVIFQTLTWKGKGAFWADIARRLLGPLVVVTTSVGAVTGVGIWILTGSLAPEGIGALIHLFFWPWFIEWFAFTAEVILLLCYYYLWDRLITHKPGTLAAIGWGYVVASFISAVLITGILGFMLTPQGWPWARSFRPCLRCTNCWPSTARWPIPRSFWPTPQNPRRCSTSRLIRVAPWPSTGATAAGTRW